MRPPPEFTFRTRLAWQKLQWKPLPMCATRSKSHTTWAQMCPASKNVWARSWMTASVGYCWSSGAPRPSSLTRILTLDGATELDTLFTVDAERFDTPQPCFPFALNAIHMQGSASTLMSSTTTSEAEARFSATITICRDRCRFVKPQASISILHLQTRQLATKPQRHLISGPILLLYNGISRLCDAASDNILSAIPLEMPTLWTKRHTFHCDCFFFTGMKRRFHDRCNRLCKTPAPIGCCLAWLSWKMQRRNCLLNIPFYLC